jgi:DNA-binding NarL/FixJ family response regulator
MPSSSILVLTTYDGDEDIYRALQAGAKGYLLKDLYGAELLQAIRGAAAGHRIIPARVAVRLAEHVASCELTERELIILRLIVEGQSNREIGKTLSISEGTVKGHVKNLFQKIGVSDRTQAATVALRRGFVHIDELSSLS